MMTIARWRKASRSAQEANCIEVAHTLAAIRDSKNTAGPVLSGDLATLIAAVKADHFAR